MKVKDTITYSNSKYFYKLDRYINTIVDEDLLKSTLLIQKKVTIQAMVHSALLYAIFGNKPIKLILSQSVTNVKEYIP